MEGCSASSPALEETLEEDEEDPELCLEESETMEKPTGSRSAVLTRRGITLRVLLKDGLVAPGEGVLSIHYLGKKFVGDLLSDGKIRWQETGHIFNSPSAWATHCKKLVNPAKKSGCGWASVRYKGQKLDQYKTTWLMKHQSFNHPTETNVVSEGEDEVADEDEDDKCHISECSTGRKLEDLNKKQNQSLEQGTADTAVKKLEKKERIPVRYSCIGNRDLARDPRTLVEVMPFSALNKFQPFNVAVSSNVLLLVDFHCHLTTSEVVGYLGGRWDTNTQLLTVLRAFPCRVRLGDLQSAGTVEEEICQSMFMRGLSLVGWYHSHPFSHALPSLQDIDSQMDYQLKLQGSNNNFQPCLALICGPYHNGNPSSESKILPFYVMPPPEQRASDYGIPMEVEVTYVQDNFLPNDALSEMALLVEHYKGAPDHVKFKDTWNQHKTYLDKLKESLAGKTPKDQGYAPVMEQIYSSLL